MPRNYNTASEAARRNHRLRGSKRYWSDPESNKEAAKERRLKTLSERPFIGWDGEGWTDETNTHHYMLFGNSNHEYVVKEDLSTIECLDLILFTESQTPDAFHVGFAFEYDVQMILKDLSWRHLAMLYVCGKVVWNRYKISHVPHKSFTVSKGGVTATIYDVFGFFHCSYMAALRKYKIGSADLLDTIGAGKGKRGLFTWQDIEYVTTYWKAEISLLPSLMDELRVCVYAAGMYISEWHGPGALAAFTLRAQGVSKWKGNEADIPPDVKVARRAAYAGGRFQSWRAGLYLGPVYTADINSAYIYACSLLPRLDTGRWVRRDPRSIDSSNVARFGLYQLHYNAGSDKEAKARYYGIPFPLFNRSKKGMLTWPHRTENWYWSPEAKLVIGDPNVTVIAAWEYLDDGTKPFMWVWEMFESRLRLQEQNHPAEKGMKWALASMYGQFARRVGWNKAKLEAPRSHQLEWAGFITSWCRAMVYTAAVDVAKRGGLVSIDTDGVTSLVPFSEDALPNGIGRELGKWKLEEFTGILHWQNGIYWLRDENNHWIEPKSRGIPRGSLNIGRAAHYLRLWLEGDRKGCAVVPMQRQKFIGYRQAIHGNTAKWRHWIKEPFEVAFGGNGKGSHITGMCRKCSGDGSPMHTIINFPPPNVMSEPHHLPWLDPKPDKDFGFPDEDNSDFGFPDRDKAIVPDDLMGV